MIHDDDDRVYNDLNDDGDDNDSDDDDDRDDDCDGDDDDDDALCTLSREDPLSLSVEDQLLNAKYVISCARKGIEGDAALNTVELSVCASVGGSGFLSVGWIGGW